MEDWGWYASVKTRDTDVSVGLLVYAWNYLDHCWLIGLDPKQRLLRRKPEKTIRATIDYVANGIDGIIGSDGRFESFGLREQNPFDSRVTDPQK
jgi:hypothetical protein